MTTSDKVRIVFSIVAAAGLFGVCSVVFNNEAMPFGIRAVTEVLAVTNLVCTIVTAQELAKKAKK